MTAPVRRTSDWMAVARADERAQPDAYLDDPCAELFATDEARRVVETFRPVHPPSEVVPVRGRLSDQTLLESGVRQAVSLGAGSDSRAYRLPLPPDLTYFEVDLPGQLEGKAELLASGGFEPKCRVVRVDADLRDPPTPVAPTFSRNIPTHWIIEGLLYYLSTPEADALVDWLSAQSAPGSWLTFDIPHPRFYREPDQQPFLREMEARGVPFVGAIEDPAAWLGSRGWMVEAVTHRDIAEGRCPWLPPLPQRLRTRESDIWLVRAHSGRSTTPADPPRGF